MNRDLEFLEYGQALEASPDETGGKARNLALCHREGHTVPDGVVLPLSVCGAFDGTGLPERLFRSISARLGDAEHLVVRSSSPVEDSPRLSWAGQFVSLVCPNEPAALGDACRACWSSRSAAAAATYAEAAGEKSGPLLRGMALLIQQLVPATTAGVCFTPGPEQDRQIHLVNAVHGLGGALTDDEAPADHYEVDLSSGAVSRTAWGRQREWRSPDAPRLLQTVPDALAGRQVLEPAQAARVAEMAQKAATVLGCRADVEWAFHGDTLYLVQARPVTSDTGKTAYLSWTRDNAADVIPGAVTPLSWSFLQSAVNHGFRRTLRLLRPGLPRQRLFSLIDGRVYFNMTAYTGLTGETGHVSGFLAFCCGYLRLLLRHKATAGRAEARFPDMLDTAATGSPAEALATLQHLFERYMLIHVRTAVLMDLGLMLLKAVLRKRSGEKEANRLTDQLLGGSGRLASCASTEELRRMAAVIGEDADLTRRLREAAPRDVGSILDGAGPAVKDSWSGFLRRHGHGALEEFELLQPRWHEQPDFVARALQRYLAEADGPAVSRAEPSPENRRQRAQHQLKRNVPWPVRFPVSMLVTHLRRCSLLRESYKQLLVRIVSAARSRALAVAADRAIDPPELVFFLTVEEALGTGDGDPGVLLEQAGQRRREWRKAAAAEPWAEIREYPGGRLARIPRLERHGPLIEGLALSQGHYTGTARVILDPARAGEFRTGDVLVARATNPSWTPLIALAGAVATDMGNYLSHGAIVARELGIPAVGNLYDATVRISDGQQVEVDGDQGLVRLPRDEQ